LLVTRPQKPPAARDALFQRLFDLTGRVAIVTGGAGRLGREYARTLADAGAHVSVWDLASAIGALQDAIAPADISVQAVDIMNRDAVLEAMDTVTRTWGAPSILVNNAGLGASPVGAALENGPFEDYPEAAWDAMLDSHLKGAFFVSQAFLRAYRSDSRLTDGSVINVSSTYGVVTPDQTLYEYRRREGVPYFKPVGYSVAKSGMLNFTRWLAEYSAPFGVRVNTLVPGGVREEGHAPEFVAEYERRTPLGRMARADDYNGAVLFLASPASSYMTGAMLVVDGGWTAR
jgi:NAD(P)-dependent dehydrogenase (short-subunit alcohol dehydrogenase family)